MINASIPAAVENVCEPYAGPPPLTSSQECLGDAVRFAAGPEQTR